jgi:glycosyltransferase involved in cell wall biosynthesis
VAKSRRKSILFIIGGFRVGGKERQLAELIKNLPQDVFELHLLVKNNDTYYLDTIKEHLTSFHSLERSNFRFLDFLTLARHIDRVEPDVVCSWTRVTSHFCLLARYFSSQSFTLLNCCIRNAPVRLPVKLKFERFMYGFYSNVIANSHAGLKAYGQSGRKGRYVLYNGLDFKRIPVCSQLSARQELGFDPDLFIVVMVASLTELKDHEMLLRAAAECEKRVTDLEILIVGDGKRRMALEGMVEALGLGSTVKFLGRRDDVELIFRAANLSVLCSTAWYGEGVSNSILESMASGVPVIATDSPGTREVIVNNVNGYIVNCGDYKSVADKIVELQSQPAIVQEISRKAQERIAEKFSILQLIDNFEQIVENCSELDCC